jgi:hypothetical protein
LQNAVKSTISGSTTVTRSAIKTMPLGTIESALGGSSEPQNQLYANGVELTPSDEVDVVALSGSFWPPGANQRANWEIQIINPATGWVASTRASSNGTWPPFFDSLPG